jgi:hypothetical protein
MNFKNILPLTVSLLIPILTITALALSRKSHPKILKATRALLGTTNLRQSRRRDSPQQRERVACNIKNQGEGISRPQKPSLPTFSPKV